MTTCELSWHEAVGEPGRRLVVRVETLAVGSGWRFELSVRNDSAAEFRIGRPHHADGSNFGLTLTSEPEVLPTILRADHIVPPLPKTLKPRSRWTGSIRGAQSLPSGKPIRVVLGAFTVFGDAPVGIRARSYSLFVSDHTVTLAPGQPTRCITSLVANR